MPNLYVTYLLRLQKEIEIVITEKTSVYMAYYKSMF